ncbi:hypothetical protein H2201_000977 [Coniosporium apollinis]|uniref:Peptidase M20 dimerisation domain-containing protein n=2 Tax=Coniosporium TaxID=2810619 RepID=A0ABQ9P3T4_9PEZI|nr:hypothetical protein H2199_003234 [Cladosporium sp. JES 115]KAJ9668733.1 hypothetical protein H2201_000977 [Coniosporium apollinis]
MASDPQPLSEDITAKIIKAVESNFDKQIAYTQELIRFGGQRGEEFAIQEHVYQQLESRGYAVDKFDMDEALISAHEGAGKFTAEHSKAPIVVAVHKPRETKGKSLILNSHVDVVPTGPKDLWTHPPYSAIIEGDWLYGRGGADMLGGSAANLYALDALRSIGLQPAAEVTVQSVVEEESTGNGTLMTHLKGYTADTVVIPEPEEEMLVRANVGVLWFQVEVRGTPVHVREMGKGANAIDAIYRVVTSLRELEEEWNARKSTLSANFKDEAHPINLNIGKIEGGDWASSVPAWCRIDCRIAIYPGTPAAAAAAEIEQKIADFAKSDPFLSQTPPRVTWNGFFSEGYEMETGSAAEHCLAQAHKCATGEDLQTFMTAGYLDTRVHVLYDKIPALCYGPISRNIHGFDEGVSVKSLKRITTAIALFIAQWCGVESIEV